MLATPIMFGGCAGVDTSGSTEQTRALIIEEMKEVATLVTPQHFEKCKEVLERPGLLGAKYQVAGPFTPSLRHSCVVQGWGTTLIRAKTDHRKRLAYSVPLRKVEGAFGTGHLTQGYCAFSSLNGVVQYEIASAQLYVKMSNQCTGI